MPLLFAGRFLMWVVRMRRQRRDQQGLGVGMQGPRAEFCRLCEFHQLAKIHYGDPVADMRNAGEIMADEQVAHA